MWNGLKFRFFRFLIEYCYPQVPDEKYNSFLNKVMSYYKGSFPLTAKANIYARMVHGHVNQWYDGKPYYNNHLLPVLSKAILFSDYIDPIHKDIVYASCLLHDSIEDARLTYNNILELFGVDVANIVYALTNEKGKTREERANDKYYAGIRRNRHAIFVKLCDRAANVEHSKKTGSSMYKKYKKENTNFLEKIYNSDFESLFKYMKSDLWK